MADFIEDNSVSIDSEESTPQKGIAVPVSSDYESQAAGSSESSGSSFEPRSENENQIGRETPESEDTSRNYSASPTNEEMGGIRSEDYENRSETLVEPTVDEQLEDSTESISVQEKDDASSDGNKTGTPNDEDNKSQISSKTDTSFEIVHAEPETAEYLQTPGIDAPNASEKSDDPTVIYKGGVDIDFEIGRRDEDKRHSVMTFSDGTASSRTTLMDNSTAVYESSSQFDVRDAHLNDYDSQENVGIGHPDLVPLKTESNFDISSSTRDHQGFRHGFSEQLEARKESASVNDLSNHRSTLSNQNDEIKLNDANVQRFMELSGSTETPKDFKDSEVTNATVAPEMRNEKDEDSTTNNVQNLTTSAIDDVTKSEESSRKTEESDEQERRRTAFRKGEIDRSSVSFKESRRKFLQTNERSGSLQVGRSGVGSVKRHVGRASLTPSVESDSLKRASSLTSLDPDLQSKMERQRQKSGGEEMMEGLSIDEMLHLQREARANTVQKMDIRSRYDPSRSTVVDPRRFSITPDRASVGKLDMDAHVKRMLGKHHAAFEDKLRSLFGEKYKDYSISYDDVLKYWKGRLKKIERENDLRTGKSWSRPTSTISDADDQSNFEQRSGNDSQGIEQMSDIEAMLESFFTQEGLEDSDNLNTLILKDLRASEFTPENQIEATGVPVYTISPSEGDVFSSSVPNLPTNLTLSESQGDETTNDVSSHPEIVLDDEFTFVEEEKNENIKTEGAELGVKIQRTSNSVSMSNEKEPLPANNENIDNNANNDNNNLVPQKGTTNQTSEKEENYQEVERRGSNLSRTLRKSSTTSKSSQDSKSIRSRTSTNSSASRRQTASNVIAVNISESRSEQVPTTSRKEVSPGEKPSFQSGVQQMKDLATTLDRNIDNNSPSDLSKQHSTNKNPDSDVARGLSIRDENNPPAVIEVHQLGYQSDSNSTDTLCKNDDNKKKCCCCSSCSIL